MTERKGKPEMQTDDLVAAEVSNSQELREAQRSVRNKETRGAVLLTEAGFQGMQHAGLFATVLLSGFGPTVQTVSLGSFDGQWFTGQLALLRTYLQPFRAPYAQVIAVFEPGFELPWTMIEITIANFVANNGAHSGTEDWARPLLETVPTGVIATPVARDAHMTHTLSRAFSRLLSQATWHLAERLLHMAGRPEGDATHISKDTPEDARPEFKVPRASLAPPWFEDHEHGLVFRTWWKCVRNRDYECALYRRVSEAWVEAMRSFPASEHIPKNSMSFGFQWWWRFFDPCP